MTIKQDLITYGRSLGFERVGITSAAPLERDEAFLKQWITEGRAGEMSYLEREPERRSRPGELLPGAKSVISLAMTYDAEGKRDGGKEGKTKGNLVPDARQSSRTLAPSLVPSPEGRIARYAYGGDYHKVIQKRLDSFVRYLESMAPGADCRTFVDTGPLLERALAQRSGLGFIGKNTMLITKGLGSWVFLANVITTLELPIDAPDDRSCGECHLCIDACPTEAITAPFALDPRRCIAYLTIEKDGSIDPELRAETGAWIFGCDICQEVCPHNLPNRNFQQKPGGTLMLENILSITTEAEFSDKFTGTSVMRAGRDSFVRNACVAAANLGRTDLSGRLQALAKNDSSPIVREHAAWALETLRAGHASSVPPASIPNPAQS